MNAILDLHEASCDCRHWQCVALTLRRIRKKRWTNIYIFVYDCFLWKRYSPWTSKTDLLPFLLKVVSGSIFIVSLLDELTRIRQCERKLLETIWLSFSFFQVRNYFVWKMHPRPVAQYCLWMWYCEIRKTERESDSECLKFCCQFKMFISFRILA